MQSKQGFNTLSGMNMLILTLVNIQCVQ